MRPYERKIWMVDLGGVCVGAKDGRSRYPLQPVCKPDGLSGLFLVPRDTGGSVIGTNPHPRSADVDTCVDGPLRQWYVLHYPCSCRFGATPRDRDTSRPYGC